MTDTATLQIYLTEARTALHKLMTGRRAVSVSFGGRSVTYTQADKADLQSYIAELEAQLAGTDGTSAGARRRPFEVYF